MEQDRIALVRQRAHAIWIEQGKPEGLAGKHWLQAEQEVDAAAAAGTAVGKVTAATAPDVGAAPQFETPVEPPVPPDVVSITEAAAVPNKSA